MEEKKNLLYVGDRTTTTNYGSIATSEALRNLLVQRFKNVKYVYYESLFRPTPLEGWDNYKPIPATPLDKLKKIARGPYSLMYKAMPDLTAYICTNILKMIALPRQDVPYLLEQYDACCEKMLKGDILQYEYDLIKWSDIVFINGEGSFVHGTDKYGKYRPDGLYILFLAYFAKKYLKKYCAIVNHTVDPDNQDAVEMINHVYPRLDYITVREPFSEEKLASWGINNARVVPDALFTFKPEDTWAPSEKIKAEIDFSQPYICLGDGSGIRSNTNRVKWDVYTVYGELIDKLKHIVPQIVFIDGFNDNHKDINRVIKHHHLGKINLHNCSYKELYQVLKNSEIFISGRYHSSILSVMSGTPIISWSADSYKTKGLYRLLDYPYKIFEIDTIPVHIDDIISEVKIILENREEIKTNLLQKVASLRDLSYGHVTFTGY